MSDKEGVPTSAQYSDNATAKSENVENHGSPDVGTEESLRSDHQQQEVDTSTTVIESETPNYNRPEGAVLDVQSQMHIEPEKEGVDGPRSNDAVIAEINSTDAKTLSAKPPAANEEFVVIPVHRDKPDVLEGTIP